MRTAAVALALLVASTASAAPMTLGTWRPAPPPCECGDTPVSNSSLDGKDKNGAFIVAMLSGIPTLTGFEYLDAPDGFTFAGWDGPTLYRNTAYDSVMTVLSDGRFHVDNGHGDTFDSQGAGADHFLLWRRTLYVTPTESATEYWTCYEDLPAGRLLSRENAGAATQRFGDCNDGISRYVERAPVVCLVGCEPPQPVPEPSALLLSALAIAGCAWRRRRA